MKKNEPQAAPPTTSSGDADAPDRIKENIGAIADLYAKREQGVTIHQRGVERLTNALARPSLLYALLACLGVWVGVNLLLPALGLPAFDPPPFSWLQGLVSLSGLLIATLVLISQKRQLKLADKRSHLDLQINLLAEGKIAKVIALLEELRRDLPNVADRADVEAEAMQTRADPQAVIEAIEESIDADVHDDERDEEEPPPSTR